MDETEQTDGEAVVEAPAEAVEESAEVTTEDTASEEKEGDVAEVE